ncbi:MAG: LolA family protein [Solirubrobacteraceae bacterium]
MNMLRRLPLSRLILLCVLVVAIGISATALAFALGAGPKPPAEPLADAVHDALAAPSVQGVSANITLTDHLLEGANLASGTGSGGGLASSPLLTGASGRLWIAEDGHVRLELQSEKGDTQITSDGHTVMVYDAASNTIYRYTPKEEGSDTKTDSAASHEVPSVGKIEEAIAKIRKHAGLSDATPADVAGQPAYTVRLSPSEGGSLFGGVELSFDSQNGVPLRSAVYSSTSSAPVIELAATEVSFGAVPDSVFQIDPPANAKVEELSLPEAGQHGHKSGKADAKPGGGPKLTSHGHGVTSIAVLEAKAGSAKTGESLAGLPKVDINGATASELRTELGTVLTFERAGVRYVLAGSLPAGSIEALARGL